MPTAALVRKHLTFKTEEDGLLSYQISDNANDDSWKEIYVIYNARVVDVNYELTGDWQVAALGDSFDFDGKRTVSNKLVVPRLSMAVLFQK